MIRKLLVEDRGVEDRGMSIAAKRKHYTFDDFCTLVKEYEKADLIDGVIYMASPENTGANKVMAWLGGVMQMFVEENDLGNVFLNRVAFHLSDTESPEPDIAIVLKEHRDRIRRGRIAGPPDLAVEIVSPDSVERDYQKKRLQYQAAGVPEYWIVDEIKERVTVLRLGPRRKYREVAAKRGRITSETLPGFWIESRWLWPASRPTMLKAFRQIMGE